jgi:hypothetical protein
MQSDATRLPALASHSPLIHTTPQLTSSTHLTRTDRLRMVPISSNNTDEFLGTGTIDAYTRNTYFTHEELPVTSLEEST